MSSQHGHGIPGPPLTPGSAGSASGDFYSQRRRLVLAQPPSITTNFLRVQGGSPLSQTPISGVSTAGNATPYPYSPNTPVSFISTALHPASHSGPSGVSNPGMEPYSSRQWSQNRHVSGAQRIYGRAANAALSTRETTGMEEAMPSPPPPYSSPETLGSSQQVRRTSPLPDSTRLNASPLPIVSSSHNSPAMPMSPAFPPPPGQSSRHRERSASGLAGTRAFLSGLRGKQAATVEPQVQVGNTMNPPLFDEQRPPAARRAASTGHIQGSAHPISVLAPPSSSERVTPEKSWQPGMPLPPPPPGPPPPGARSQSLNRYAPSSTRSNSITSEDGFESQHQRRVVATSTLGPIPPTPAGWTEDQQKEQSERSQSELHVDGDATYQPLRIDTGAGREASITRRPARRETSTQGIRERRSQSRRARECGADHVMSPASDDSRPSDLIFMPVDGSISRRRERTRAISRHAEPSPKTGAFVHSRYMSQVQPVAQAPATVMNPPYTPAVGSSGREDGDTGKIAALRVPGSASSDRPISHLLHTPNEDSSIPAPLSPSRPASAGLPKRSTKLNGFALQALERHQTFVEKEAAATSDEERLQLFAKFMVHESRLRRDRYTAAYNAMAGDIVDFTRDMWRSYTKSSKRAVTPSTSVSSFDPMVPSWASDGPVSAHAGMPSSASSIGDFTPATDVGSIGEGADFERGEPKQWAETFKPSLSPIQSVAQSNGQDEDSSRGRAPSRWWEQSSGSGSIGRPDRIEKSHRETKYMGVWASELQETAEPSPALSRQSATPGASMQRFSSSDYPPEKSGWHEEADLDTPMATPAQIRKRKSPTPSLEPLNISRLVTLPPPYPRHHPAVNNSHPLLAGLRSEHRELADHRDIQKIKDDFLNREFAVQQEQKEAAKVRRSRLHSSIQAKISNGSISFAAAASSEAEFDKEEAERGKANARAVFDLFETHVAQPLHPLLTARLAQATAALGQLRTELTFGVHASDPNQAQEEGDEQPERLEKLTLLKWLFEAREHLHKAMFDLLAARSEKYSEVILSPYRILGLETKVNDALAFFAKDNRTRQLAFAREALTRYQDLEAVMSRNVSRGVEDQLSAFWDIAPMLLEVIVRVPEKGAMKNFEVAVPEREVEENPGYAVWPLQYLYCLLGHAERSAYGFIESQVNLLCLLHEVRTAVARCAGRARDLERMGAEGMGAGDAEEVERRLDGDLKDKVVEVEEQWRVALGEGLKGCKESVKGWLIEAGGWEEGLDE